MVDAALAPAPEATPEAAPTGAPAAPEDWRSALPEDVRADPSLKDIKDIAGLAKGYVHAQKLVGMDRNKFAVVPGEDAAEDAWNDFYEKIGRPKSADEYKLPVEQIKFDDSFRRDENAEAWLKTTAHKYGLSAKQAAGMYKEYMGFAQGGMQQVTQQQNQAREQALASLKGEFGADYDPTFQKVTNLLRNNADDEALDFLDRTGFGNEPAVFRMFAKIAKSLGEDSVTDRSQGGTSAMNPAEAQAGIAQKMADPDFMKAYTKGDHPSHKWAVGEMAKLHRAAGGKR
jgi:hypothetical protein